MAHWMGDPSELTIRRWKHFGQSGAKLIWGGEAVAVRHDGRANPNQLMINRETLPDLASLRQVLVDAHQQAAGSTKDLLIGLQLTHSGRFARPNDKKRLDSFMAYDHPILNAKFGLPAVSDKVVSDAWIDDLIGDFARAAVLAQEAGFDFVDLKHCHGYFGHELLSAVDRPGRYGGSFENRTRFLRELVRAVRRDAPGLKIGVRLSAFDFVPFQKGEGNIGVPVDFGGGKYRYAFGGDGTGLGIDLTEPPAFLQQMQDLGIALVCITGGSPYYVPHIQRPAYTPPSDGYLPPEDPLIGVARQMWVTRELKSAFPGHAGGRLGLFLPAGLAAQCGPGRCAPGLGRQHRPGPHGAFVPGDAAGYSGGTAAAAQSHLPHLQRLHHRAAQRHGFGLLSAG